MRLRAPALVTWSPLEPTEGCWVDLAPHNAPPALLDLYGRLDRGELVAWISSHGEPCFLPPGTAPVIVRESPWSLEPRTRQP